MFLSNPRLRFRLPWYDNASGAAAQTHDRHLPNGSRRTHRHGGRWFGLALTLSLTSIPVAAQHATVEHMEFDCGGSRCLVLNGYAAPIDTSSVDGVRRRPKLTERDVAALRVALPIKALPEPEPLQAFLSVVGLQDLSALASVSPQAAGSNATERRLAAWASLVSLLRTRDALQIGEVRVTSVAVEDALLRIYEEDGYLEDGSAVLPHLVRGVLAVYDARGNLAVGTRRVDLGLSDYGRAQSIRLHLANLGARPLHIRPRQGLLASGRLEGAVFQLRPGERTIREVRYAPAATSLITGVGRASVICECDGRRRVLLQVLSTAGFSLAGTAAALNPLRFGHHARHWREFPLYRAGVLLLALGMTLLAILAIRWSYGAPAVAALVGLRNAIPGLRERAELRSAAETEEPVQPSWIPDDFRARIEVWQARGGSTLRMQAERVGAAAGYWLRQTGGDALLSARDAVHAMRGRLPAFHSRTDLEDPLDADAYIERVAQRWFDLAYEPDTDALRQRNRLALRREVLDLVHRLDAELQQGRVPPTAKLFQMRWALRLLAQRLSRRGADPAPVVELWLRGATRMSQQAQIAVGPINDDLMALMRGLQG